MYNSCWRKVISDDNQVVKMAKTDSLEKFAKFLILFEVLSLSLIFFTKSVSLSASHGIVTASTQFYISWTMLQKDHLPGLSTAAATVRIM